MRIINLRWRENNPDKAKESWNKSYIKKKLNLKFCLNKSISTSIYDSLKKNKGSKNGRHWEDLVGYTVECLKLHLESTLPYGYDWQDYLDGKLHIDHIIPISVFNFNDASNIDFQKCWDLDNLQLLPAKENLVKSNKLEQSFQQSLAI